MKKRVKEWRVNLGDTWLKNTLMAVVLMVMPLTLSSVSLAEVTDNSGSTYVMQGERQEHQVNINSADAERLAAKLKGVGLIKAQAIIAYRDEFGPFAKPSDLLKVKGIGRKTLSQFAAQLIF